MSLKYGFKQMLAEANAAIDTVAVKDAIAVVGEAGYAFIDIREGEERAQGTIAGSAHVPRGIPEFHADPDSPAHNQVFSSGDRLILFCATGGRSALAAKTLLDMGFEDVCHIAGGMAAWREADGPVE